MFTPAKRAIFIIIGLIVSAYFYSKEDYAKMALTLIACGLIIYGYFKYGTVYAAFQQLQKDDVEKAEELISKIRNPEKLSEEHKSYYYFTTGIIALKKQEFQKSHSDLARALEIGLRTENEKSIVLLNLATVELLRKNLIQSNEYIKKVKELDLKPLVALQVIEIEREIEIAEQA